MPDKANIPKVLVIDDEVGPRESLRYLLKNKYQVLCADGVDRGLELLREHSPDLIILDIRMPGRSGIEGLQEIRRIDADVAVIMLTGYGALSTAQQAVRHAANEYVEKPFDTVEMCRTVERHVQRTRARRQRELFIRELEQVHERVMGELQHKEHLAELGAASAEFVHDLRNAFAVVCGSAELLRMEKEGDVGGTEVPQTGDDSLAAMERTIARCRDLLEAWHRLIHREASQQRVFALDDFVKETVASCQPAATAAQANLSYENRAGDTHMIGDTVQLGRAIANLIHNAIQALPPKDGWVRVSASSDGTEACVRVADNGCGIAPENLERIFQPKFTTKAERGGMGLGLFIARKVAESHGGKLSAESAVGKGTTMVLTLPLAVDTLTGAASGSAGN